MNGSPPRAAGPHARRVGAGVHAAAIAAKLISPDSAQFWQIVTAIGLTITMDILGAGRLTGAVMNPARAFGPALLSGHWEDQAVWWIGPIVGAVIAALLYHYVFIEEPARG